MFEYEVVLGYYECPTVDEYQITEIIMANTIEQVIKEAEELYSDMVIVSIDGYSYNN